MVTVVLCERELTVWALSRSREGENARQQNHSQLWQVNDGHVIPESIRLRHQSMTGWGDRQVSPRFAPGAGCKSVTASSALFQSRKYPRQGHEEPLQFLFARRISRKLFEIAAITPKPSAVTLLGFLGARCFRRMTSAIL